MSARADVIRFVKLEVGETARASGMVGAVGVTLGIHSTVLAALDQPGGILLGGHGCHWSAHARFITFERRPTWLAVGGMVDALAAGAEIAALLGSRYLPLIESLSSTAALRARWQEEREGAARFPCTPHAWRR